jgi:cyclohexadienyl dehydratase
VRGAHLGGDVGGRVAHAAPPSNVAHRAWSTRRGRTATVLCLVAAVAGCALRPAAPHAPAPPPLRVGTSGDYAPFSTRAADGTLAGFDIEVARAFAAERGREVVLVPFRWPELGVRFAAGDFDVVMSGVTVRPDRLVAGIFTAGVARSDAVLVVAASTASSGSTTVRAFDRAGRTIAVNRGGHLEQVARARFPRATIVTVDDNTRLPSTLTDGTAEAIVTDTLELASFQTQCPVGSELACLRVVATLSRDEKAYWLPSANGALATDLDGWLLARERSGWLPALRARYLTGAEPATLGPAETSLVARLRRRLTLMPAVVAAKRLRGLPIEDREREAAVERDAAARAGAVGLDPKTFVALVRAEIEAAKAIQTSTPKDVAAPHSLDELRLAINRLDARIAFELAALAPLDASEATVAEALADDDVPGLTAAVARTLARALRAVQAAPGALSTGRICGASCMLAAEPTPRVSMEVEDAERNESMQRRPEVGGEIDRSGGGTCLPARRQHGLGTDARNAAGARHG